MGFRIWLLVISSSSSIVHFPPLWTRHEVLCWCHLFASTNTLRKPSTGCTGGVPSELAVLNASGTGFDEKDQWRTHDLRLGMTKVDIEDLRG